MTTPLPPTQPAERYLTDAGGAVEFDASGFLRPDVLTNPIRPRELLEAGAWIVHGVPTVGKSRLLRLLDSFVHSAEGFGVGPAPAKFQHSAFSNMANPDHVRNLKPEWLDAWAKSAHRPALWLVDALDEGELVRSGISFALLEILSGIPEQRRPLLRFVITARANEVQPAVIQGVQSLLGARVVELQPVHREEARTLVSDEATFSRVCEIMTGAEMRAVAGLPMAIEALGRELALGAVGAWTPPRVWATILRHLIAAPFRPPHRELPMSSESIMLAVDGGLFPTSFDGRGRAATTSAA